MDFIRMHEDGNRDGFVLPKLEKIKLEEGVEVLPLVVDHFYITSDGYEYIKLSTTELWYFILSCIALEQLDTEPGFYGLSIYVAKENRVGGTDLNSFVYQNVKSTVADLCELASQGVYNESNCANIVTDLRITA